MKTGVGAAFNSFKIRSFTENPGMSTWNRSMVYDVAPFRIYAYMQDKVEYKGFIANLGLRGDICATHDRGAGAERGSVCDAQPQDWD